MTIPGNVIEPVKNIEKEKPENQGLSQWTDPGFSGKCRIMTGGLTSISVAATRGCFLRSELFQPGWEASRVVSTANDFCSLSPVILQLWKFSLDNKLLFRYVICVKSSIT